MFKRCNHSWKVLQEVTTESKGEVQLRTVGVVSSPKHTEDYVIIYERKHITILSCEHCSKLKRFVEEI